jgi:large repetitive protein
VDAFGPSILDRTPTITWNAQDRVTSWQVWVNKVDEVPALIQYVEDGLTSPEFTIPSDLVNGQYKVWVRGFADGVVTEWSPAFEFGVGGRPVVTNPAFTSDSTPTLSWLPVEDAVGYEVYFAAEGDVPNPILRESGLSATSVSVSDELTPGIYKFWVRAIAPDGSLTPWSLNSQSTIAILPIGTPVLNDVPDGADPTPTITWSDLPEAARYEVFISLAATPTTPVVRFNGLTSATFTPATPLASGDYRVWVRAISASSEVGAWSVPDSFTVATSESNKEGRQNVVQLASLVAAATTWEPEDVTVSQIPARVVSESGQPVHESRRQAAVADLVDGLPHLVSPDDSAEQLEELQSGDDLMAAWDDAIWNEESAAGPAADVNDSASGQKQAAATGWLAGLAAFSPTLFKKRRNNGK